MPRSRTRFRALMLPLCVAVPVGVAIVLNAIVRPWLAESLDGARRTSFTNAKSADGWWEFSDQVRTAHPAATSFLETSDGAIATAGIALAALVCGALLAGDSLRRSEERKRG
ncbi:hypothetical protein [Leucobacter aridicollis]|uniref:hypothetical protein n=1 Tax=Leucobacter aridicollis TaxID=283878 RepID=UPI002105FAC6|nr:hypothetical protein [Leucobacter aridicollis]UTX52291.1 hypothetical protein KI794_11055 [Leucobacter aridicollis]